MYLYHSSEEPLFLKIQDNSRSSFSQVEEIDIEYHSEEFME